MMSAFVEVIGGTLPWVAIGVLVWALIGMDERRLKR